MRKLVFLYGAFSYVLFLGVFLYAIGFLAGAWVPRGIDDPAPIALGNPLLVNAALLGLFGIQHTIMARPAFKRWSARFMNPAIERSTFVLVTNLLFVGLFLMWQPMPETVWAVGGLAANALWATFALGFAIVLVSTFLIDHFDLFGMKQVTAYLLGKEHGGPSFKERGLYKMVRHPLMLGFLIAFWSAPVMSQGHLYFAAIVTAYVFVAVKIEESTLMYLHGDTYGSYRKRVPGILPWRMPRKAA